MTRLRNLPDDAKVYDVFMRRPDVFVPFTEACEQIMRGDSPLSRAERELIGAYVSGLNSCPYCHDVHNSAAQAYGVDADLSRQLREDLGAAPVDEKLKPLLALVRKATESAWRITDADFEAARAAGWNEDGIHDAIVVACLFNFMNRLVSTLGIEADADYLAEAGPRIRDLGYGASLEQRMGAGD